CGVCGSGEDVDCVCHRCGRPLCALHRLEYPEPTFGNADAVYCERCWQAQFPGRRPYLWLLRGQRWLQLLIPGNGGAQPPAEETADERPRRRQRRRKRSILPWK
ncbi:MAG: hypothetical protein R3272_16870, partial [Candidatus Promineifilaceae bacterium]|nr:hypothetical protein [Candidatus Promineifilaceae bacterium]